MIGLAVISSIVSIALICFNVCIPIPLSIANLIIPILSGVYILLTSIYFIYCYKNIDRNTEYKLDIIQLNGEQCMYFGRRNAYNQPIGEGVAFSNTHKYIYMGTWLNGQKHGNGEFIDINGVRYKGEWKNDKRSGQGTIKWPNAGEYTGEWENDKRSGQGQMTYAIGEIVMHTGTWEEDLFIGGKAKLRDGNIIQVYEYIRVIA